MNSATYALSDREAFMRDLVANLPRELPESLRSKLAVHAFQLGQMVESRKEWEREYGIASQAHPRVNQSQQVKEIFKAASKLIKMIDRWNDDFFHIAIDSIAREDARSTLAAELSPEELEDAQCGLHHASIVRALVGLQFHVAAVHKRHPPGRAPKNVIARALAKFAWDEFGRANLPRTRGAAATGSTLTAACAELFLASGINGSADDFVRDLIERGENRGEFESD